MKKNKKQAKATECGCKVMPVEMTDCCSSQKQAVKGQGKVLAEKKRSATWY